MNGPSDPRERGETLRSWVTVTLLAAAILVYGFIVYRAVGDKGPPAWDFGAAAYTPGESPYSTAKAPRNLGQP